MKKLSALIVILVVMFAVNPAFSQPALTLHVTGGYSLPLPDLKGTWPDDFTANKNPQPLYMKSGFNVGADGKYYFDKKLRSFGITLSLAYLGFSTGDLADTGSLSANTFNSKFNSFTVGLGVEYKFLTKKKAHPFIGAEFTGNFLSGKSTSTVGGVSTDFTMKSTSRFGLAFGAGVDIAASKNVGVIVGLKYALLNLIGKKDTSETATGTEYPLRDKAYGTVNAKNLSYMQFYAGISFYLMQPKYIKKK